ncbi:Hsp20/alpha crystallin family protein [Desulfogranum marinum]|uniref:Hsp20/alpha crystallin family protein n=1 Tax=Desulfogranum marinum TaxID=453220 RepID=UPI00196411B3|nr:Hsp20/alpha crystallin family protein [Desulfogranum marinum]MBM9512510.1 Hsp20/alpha crystallin family protein [Desulfogranum marinum]
MSDNKALTPSNKHEVNAARELPVVTPAVDIFENTNEILLHADMPGVERENISINIDNGKLYLSGTRTVTDSGATRWQEFGAAEYSRTFSVPQSIDIPNIKAHLQDGVLQLQLPKLEAAKPKQIKITTG